jgi:hypothetical protein
MPQNVLSIAQSFARRQGLPQPTFVAGNSDAQVAQILGLLEEFCDDLVDRCGWEINTKEAVFVSTADEDQGLMSAIATDGYRGMIPRTFFDRTQRLEVPVAITPEEWQMRKTLGITGPLYQARIRGGHLLFIPPPAAGHTMAFEYYSEWFVTATDGSGKKYPTADSDTFTVNDTLPIAFLRWKWKSDKGLDYAEDFRKYEIAVNGEKARLRVKQNVRLDSNYQDARPGIVVPPGSWPISN